MHNLKILQINLDRGREATEEAKLLASELDIDIICVQEPYHRFSAWNDTGQVHGEEGGKALIIVRKQMLQRGVTLNNVTDSNNVYIRGQCGGSDIIIGSVYVEPGVGLDRALNKADETLRSARDCKIIITGDFNAKNVLWGGDISDQKGGELLDWAMANDMLIINNRDDLPTFESTNGRSWIDMTLISKNAELEEWKVREEETLSWHRAIVTTIKIEGPIRKTHTRTGFIKSKADWEKFKTTLQQLIQQNNAEETMEAGERWQETCERALEAAVPKSSTKKRKRQNAGWWNEVLRRLRQKVNQARRAAQKCREPTERDRLMTSYKNDRTNYKNKIKETKIQHFRDFCQENSSQDPWGVIYKIWRGKKKNDSPMKTRKEASGEWTTNEQETIRALMEQYFPEDEEDQTHEHQTIRRDSTRQIDSRDGDPFTMAELRQVVWEAKPRKAPGRDGFPSWALRELFRTASSTWLGVFNRCLMSGTFPKAWKSAEIAWLPKDGGEFRPICLLPTIGKCLDKMCARRLQGWLERMRLLSPRQFGFRSSLGTTEALRHLKGAVDRVKAIKNHCLVVTLDIKNAFNSAWHPSIVEDLRRWKCPGNILGLVRSFLSDRVVNSKGETRDMKKGCPQGSSLGPVLWLAIMEGWFAEMAKSLTDEGDYYQAYADDQVVVLGSQSVTGLARKWKRVWDACSRWALRNKLEYSIRKTEMMFVPHARAPVRQPRFQIGDVVVQTQGSIKYLGTIFDRCGNWTAHTKHLRGKINQMAQRTFYIAGKNWGMDKSVREAIYDNAIMPMFMYGAEVWGQKARSALNRRNLDALQRPFLLAIGGAFRTAPTSAMQVLLGKPPLHICAAERHRTSEELTRRIFAQKVKPRYAPRLDERHRYQAVIEASGSQRSTGGWFCDASKTTTGVGIGVIDLTEGGETRRACGLRLPDHLEIARAELVGVKTALDMAVPHGSTDSSVLLSSDSQSALFATGSFSSRDGLVVSVQRLILAALENGNSVKLQFKSRNSCAGMIAAHKLAREAAERTDVEVSLPMERKVALAGGRDWIIAEWQRDWENCKTGRGTYSFFPAVKMGNKRLNWRATQLLTGHGYFKAYYARFGLRDTDGRCNCGAEVEDAQHVLFTCQTNERRAARDKYLAGWPEEGRGMEDEEKFVLALNKFADEVVETDRYFE